jgi:uncharacterized protein (DUF2141 family)
MIRIHSIVMVSIFVSLFGACAPSNKSDTLEITPVVTMGVKVTGLTVNSANAPSQLCYAVFNGPEGFPSDSSKVVKQGCLPVRSATLDFKIENVPSRGKGFVVSVFQDMNMSKKMETKKFFGFDVPAEPFGFTNNPSLMSGAPTFEKCKVNDVYRSAIEIKMKSM